MLRYFDRRSGKKVRFLMNALNDGSLQNSGNALGFYRMVMIFSGGSSIRDTITFSKTASAIFLMDESPSEVSEEQLKDLHIIIRKKE